LEAAGRGAAAQRWLVLGGVILALLVVFVGRTMIARSNPIPRISDLLDTIVVAGSAWALVNGYRRLSRRDWLVGLGLGFLLSLQLPWATLFQPWPFFDVIRNNWFQAPIRGAYAAMAALGGLAIARSGGPVPVRLAGGSWRQALLSLGAGAVLGIPLAILNAFANAWMQGRSFQWQSPLAAAMDALQPAVFEELLYRLAFLSLLWLVLRRSWSQRQAVWLASLLSLLAFSYGHFSDEFITQPLATLAIGGVMALIWGLPTTVLALRRDLDSAAGFHWVQDFARFWVGL
jgi:hypothetical protein